ncbi:MAG TPA: argininosuccinate lyase [bacterium]|nr:argininosuccinate lyase [bacterium]
MKKNNRKIESRIPGPGSRSLWGGRFKKGMHPVLKCYSYSLAVDGELLEVELRVDIAWVKMLARVKLVTPAEAGKMVRALQSIQEEFKGKPLCEYIKDYEDVHTLIQAFLEKKAGALAKKIHTGRSRNDLVVTSTRVYLKDKILSIEEGLRGLQKALVRTAQKAGNEMIAGLTHLKKAQPVLLAHHLLAYVEMLEEDRGRFLDAFKRTDVLPLGSAALAGSSLPLDQKFLARELGFSKIASNSMAATSDRGFLVEFLAALAIAWMHFSRLSEDFILWNSEPFGYVELDDAFATGSSLMPQKKNPDVFELTRGRAGVIFSHLQTLLVIQKGLPLAYNRDLQEDKPPVFDAIRKTSVALELLALTIESAKFHPEAMRASVQDDALFATDILEYLVRKKVPFSEAHETVGKVVCFARESGKPIRELSLPEWKKFHKAFEAGVYGLFEASVSVRAKKTIASTHPERVRNQLRQWQRILRGKRKHA